MSYCQVSWDKLAVLRRATEGRVGCNKGGRRGWYGVMGGGGIWGKRVGAEERYGRQGREK